MNAMQPLYRTFGKGVFLIVQKYFRIYSFLYCFCIYFASFDMIKYIN